MVQSGAVKIEVHQTYPLKDAAKAHADLAARKTTGSTVLRSEGSGRQMARVLCRYRRGISIRAKRR